VIHEPVSCIVRSVSTDSQTRRTDGLIWGGLGNGGGGGGGGNIEGVELFIKR